MQDDVNDMGFEMKRDDEAQPKYVSKQRSNGEEYKPWKPEVIPAQTKQHALNTMMKDGFFNSEEWQKFCDLVGKDTAIQWARAGLFSATRTD